MHEANEQSTKPKRTGPTESIYLCRRAAQMVKEIDPETGRPRGEKVLLKLFTHISSPAGSLSFQCIKILHDMLARYDNYAQQRRDKRYLAEIDKPVDPESEEELDAKIADFKARLASLTGSAPGAENQA